MIIRTAVEADLTAWHTDPIMDEGRHEHTWLVRAYFDGSKFIDARAPRAALITMLSVWQGKDMPPELWSGEAIAKTVASVLANCIGCVVKADTNPSSEILYIHHTLWIMETSWLSAEQTGAVLALVIAEVRGLVIPDERATAERLGIRLAHWRKIRSPVLAAIDRLRDAEAWRYKIRFGRDGLSAAKRAEIYERDGQVCTYCAATAGPFHIDHKHPVAKGGSNDPDNLCVACQECNLSKGAKTLGEWRAGE